MTVWGRQGGGRGGAAQVRRARRGQGSHRDLADGEHHQLGEHLLHRRAQVGASHRPKFTKSGLVTHR